MLGCSLIFFHFLWAIQPIRPVGFSFAAFFAGIFIARSWQGNTPVRKCEILACKCSFWKEDMPRIKLPASQQPLWPLLIGTLQVAVLMVFWNSLRMIRLFYSSLFPDKTVFAFKGNSQAKVGGKLARNLKLGAGNMSRKTMGGSYDPCIIWRAKVH